MGQLVDLETIQADYIITRGGTVWRRMRAGEIEHLIHKPHADRFRDEVARILDHEDGVLVVTLVSQALREYRRATGATRGRRTG